MAEGDTARKYLGLLADIEDDGVMEDLERLRHLPIEDAEKWYKEALADYLNAKLKGVWN